MGSRSGIGAAALMVFAIAGLAWFALELAPPNMGFEDTDDPGVSLRFLHAHGEVYAQGGLTLLVMSISLTVAILALWDALASRVDALALRVATAFGLLAAAFLFMHGVLRLGVEPLLYIDGLDHGWGEAGYVAIQMIGVHGFAQAAIMAACLWVTGLGLIGLRSGALPLALCLLAVIPAFRLLGVVAPFLALPEGMWFLFMASIPGLLVWCLLLGIVLLRRAIASARADRALTAIAAA